MGLRDAATLAYAAGLLLLLAHATSGSLLLELGGQYAAALLPGVVAATVRLVIALLLFIATLGGLSVIVGGFLYRKKRRRAGNLFVGLGAGTGILGLLLLAVVAFAGGKTGDLLLYLLGPAGLGVVLSIAARWKASKQLPL